MAELTFDLATVTTELEGFLRPLLAASGLKLSYELRHTARQFDREYENPDMVVDFSGPDVNILLENKGELLRALEQIALDSPRLKFLSHEQVIFDCQEFRMMRFAELGLAAQAAADKVKRTGIPYKFGAMSGRERRVIHMALRGSSDVLTESEGMGLHRQVVVRPRQGSAPPARPMGRRR